MPLESLEAKIAKVMERTQTLREMDEKDEDVDSLARSAARALEKINLDYERQVEAREELDRGGAHVAPAPRVRRIVRARSASPARTSKPPQKLNRQSSGGARGPDAVAERSKAFAKEKAARLQALREAQLRLEAAEATFAPKVKVPSRGTKTIELSREQGSRKFDGLHDSEIDDFSEVGSVKSGSVHARLFEMSRELELKQRQRRESREREVLADCTFTPQVRSQRSSAAEGSSVTQRLAQDTKKLDARRDELKRQRELEGCTFRPDTTRRSRGRSREPQKKRVDRLFAGDDAQRHAERGRLKAERELEGCTFTPRTGRSPMRDRKKPVFERMQDDDRARRARSVERQRRYEEDERNVIEERSVRVADRADLDRLNHLASPRIDGTPRDKIERQKQAELEKRPRHRSPSPRPDPGDRWRRGSSETASNHTSQQRKKWAEARTASFNSSIHTPKTVPRARRSTKDKASLSANRDHSRSATTLRTQHHKNGTPAPAPSAAIDEFERWQHEMEAKLAAL